MREEPKRGDEVSTSAHEKADELSDSSLDAYKGLLYLFRVRLSTLKPLGIDKTKT